MSVDIEYDRVAFVGRSEKLRQDITCEKYLLCVKYGSNNILNSSGEIAKDWTVLRFGTEEEIIADLDVFETSLHGGSFRVEDHRIRNIEQYKKLIRKTLKRAKDFRKFNNYFSCAERRIKISHKNEKSKKTIKEFKSRLGKEWEEDIQKEVFLGDKEIFTVFTNPIKDIKDIGRYYLEKEEGIKGVNGKYEDDIFLLK